MATKSLSLEKGTGTAFYSFDDIDNIKDCITEWYIKLNDLDLTQEQKDEIVDEANMVFDLKIGIFEELEGSALKALWSYSIKDKLGMQANSKKNTM
jgi:heme oxygenase